MTDIKLNNSTLATASGSTISWGSGVPAGTIVQVKYSFNENGEASSSSTYEDINTIPLTTILLNSSILAMWSIAVYKNAETGWSTGVKLNCSTGGDIFTDIYGVLSQDDFNGADSERGTYQFLHSPNVAAGTVLTYKTQQNSLYAGSFTLGIKCNLTLFEIAQ